MPTSGQQSRSSDGDIYKTISYASNPFPQSEPARLFALARMFGLTPPDVATMRVLELGCSSGGNIIPLAARFPSAQLLGIDLAPRHVAEATARIRAAGLDNVEVRLGDIATFDPGDARYDAIICHGVYSWIPPEARAAVLRIAGRNLAEHGVAYVSYNVLPGWYLRRVIRDLMLFHAGTEDQASPADRIAKARWVIENLSQITYANSPYGAKLREEATVLRGLGDDYIFGEFLATYNEPCYFRDFHAAAEQAGLAYLCEAEIQTCLPETHGDQVGQLIRTMSANTLVPMEQYIDFFMGRQFRQTLMVRKDQEARINRNLEPERCRGLAVHGRLEFAPDQSSDGKTVFQTPDGKTVTTINPAVRSALERLAAAFPETRTAEELIAEVEGLGAGLAPADAQAIVHTVFNMIVAGLVQPCSIPLRIGRHDRTPLVAFALARIGAAAGRQKTANLKHEPVAIDPVAAELLPHIDGNNSRLKLRKLLARAIEQGRITISDDKSKLPLFGDALERAIDEHVDLALQRLAVTSLLVPASAPS
jgi:SAM-dependent methyltransferase/methyltransferase-like protein